MLLTVVYGGTEDEAARFMGVKGQIGTLRKALCIVRRSEVLCALECGHCRLRCTRDDSSKLELPISGTSRLSHMLR